MIYNIQYRYDYTIEMKGKGEEDVETIFFILLCSKTKFSNQYSIVNTSDRVKRIDEIWRKWPCYDNDFRFW